MVQPRLPSFDGPDRDSLLAQLRAEHRALETRLAELERHLSLTAEEQLERATLKKRKLLTKDRISRLDRPS
jgi:hypothetical protein